ncbi:hypothetical protein FIBSPDRAFT_396473 [Athelia psychrophila]|uniref:Uncharacterized protein n=1 Tax=Athelia psychrophila TaxID=1759441 RepID=A0A166NPJ9_9AGAM|nr:hypothetical protein FIBSPDRAFT_396473 [Fibularhizoctonia sp. CBS 109695]
MRTMIWTERFSRFVGTKKQNRTVQQDPRFVYPVLLWIFLSSRSPTLFLLYLAMPSINFAFVVCFPRRPCLLSVHAICHLLSQLALNLP